MVKDSKNFKICKQRVLSGERKFINLELGHLYDFSELSIPIEVVNGKHDGPIIFLSGSIHGDEIIGSEIIKRILRKVVPSKLHGAIIGIPVVNVLGFNTKSRYLPDRRDLNRSFPGSIKGSLAGQMAKVFMKEIVSKSTHGIDFHSGALHRYNIPQIRACLKDKETKKIAMSFGANIIIDSSLRDGSLREAARRLKIPMLLFEGGEALRFDEEAIRVAVKGTFSVMKSIGMLKSEDIGSPRAAKIAKDSYWVRAPNGGTMKNFKKAGDQVKEGELLAEIQDLFGRESIKVFAKEKGVLIGLSRLPLVNRGDALFHIATTILLKKTYKEEGVLFN